MKLPRFMVQARAKAVEGRVAHKATISADILKRRVVWGEGAMGVRNAAQAPKTATAYLYEPIGVDMWTGEGCSPRDFVATLDAAKKAGCTALDLRIHSEGGDLLDGLAMFEALKRCGMQTTAYNDGFCASAATIVALGCDRVVVGPASEWMSHRAWAGRQGNAADMQAMADLLTQLDGTIVDIYVAKTGKSADECLAMMSAGADGKGSWMTADQCRAFGFADEIAREEDDQIAASALTFDDDMSSDRMAQGIAIAAAAKAIANAETASRAAVARAEQEARVASAKAKSEQHNRASPVPARAPSARK